MTESYTQDEKKSLLKLARDTIIAQITGQELPDNKSENLKFLEKKGVFVTLHKNNDLRGCIGYPLPMEPLYTAVIDNAISAAIKDPRFGQVSVDEMNEISIEISILTEPREISDYRDIEIGRDGIIISKGFNKGLFLPQVPIEQNWNLEQYMAYGCLKAGLMQDEWKRGVKIEIFQAIVFGEEQS